MQVDHTITDVPAVHPGPDFVDATRDIRPRHDGAPEDAAEWTGQYHQIACVQRHRMDPHLARTRLRHRHVFKHQAAGVRYVRAEHPTLHVLTSYPTTA